MTGGWGTTTGTGKGWGGGGGATTRGAGDTTTRGGGTKTGTGAGGAGEGGGGVGAGGAGVGGGVGQPLPTCWQHQLALRADHTSGVLHWYCSLVVESAGVVQTCVVQARLPLSQVHVLQELAPTPGPDQPLSTVVNPSASVHWASPPESSQSKLPSKSSKIGMQSQQ